MPRVTSKCQRSEVTLPLILWTAVGHSSNLLTLHSSDHHRQFPSNVPYIYIYIYMTPESQDFIIQPESILLRLRHLPTHVLLYSNPVDGFCDLNEYAPTSSESFIYFGTNQHTQIYFLRVLKHEGPESRVRLLLTLKNGFPKTSEE